MKRTLVSVYEEGNDVVTSLNCDFKELFSVVIHLITQMSLATDGEISYNEILDDLKMITKEEVNEYQH